MSHAKLIVAVASRVSVSRFLDYREYLQAVYEAIKQEIGKYSYLNFSDDLGFSKTNVLHLIIKGRRPLTSKAALKIADMLQLHGKDRKYFEDLVAYHNSRDSMQRELLFQELVELKAKEVKSEDALLAQLEFFTEWFHSAIYELSFTNVFTSDPKQLAAMLTPRIRPEQARKSLELLQRLGLVTRDEDSGSYTPTQTRISTGDEIASLAITRYHQKMIELGKESLTAIQPQSRDVSSVSIAIPSSLLPEVKKEISLFRKKLLNMAEQASNADVVYQTNIQFFPLSRDKGAKS
ncbi:MAG TPA: TIGR02147 family protein [Oligoflexus sp.]|uniref:TIGR02147 family protein n=1 Tax=Oligoflexus sp. TaxID=1971216 RepID=UPI002D27378B|nr:TIGR02147 family protein [Oligoflexus sp.]HYX38529.1 TIGR02147 family protein [Oligoflexus sp.]